MLKYEVVITDYDIRSIVDVITAYKASTSMSEESFQYHCELISKLRACLEREQER